METLAPFLNGETEEEGVAGLADLFACGLHVGKRRSQNQSGSE